MNNQDQEIWFKLAHQLEQVHEKMDIRSLSNSLYAFYQISKNAPVIFDFSDLFFKLELPLIKRFLTEEFDT